MPILKKEQFEQLSKFDNNPCISIFMPTTRAGKDVLEEKDRIQLKSQWKKVYEKLKDLNLSQDKIDSIGKPVEDLLADTNFWRHQSDGLAIFLADGFFQKFTIPVNFEPYAYVSNHFYLKPLVPMFTGDGRFYLLSLQMDKVKLYEGSKYSIGEIKVDDLTPSRLEDRVGYDYEERNRQQQTLSQGQGQGGTVFQGDNAAEKDRKNEILRFFNAVDKGLHNLLRDEKVPLIVACQDYLFPIYREANSYKNIFPEPVPGNPQDYENMLALHASALNKLEPYFNKQKDGKVQQFDELPPEKKSTTISEILPAIFQGKVDTLFLQNREDIWGNYNENMSSVEVDEAENSRNISLMNLAAVKVLEQNGRVYLIEGQFMPNKNSKINAVYRY